MLSADFPLHKYISCINLVICEQKCTICVFIPHNLLFLDKYLICVTRHQILQKRRIFKYGDMKQIFILKYNLWNAFPVNHNKNNRSNVNFNF